MTTNPTHDQVTEAVEAEFGACHRELRDARENWLSKAEVGCMADGTCWTWEAER